MNELITSEQRDEAFKSIKSYPENKFCLDCEKKNPSWCSIYFGIHLCMDCAGKHRQYGVMYSFVKSANLDSWTKRQVMFMLKGGNARALEYLRKCGAISATNKIIDYKSAIVQKYKQMLTAEVDGDSNPNNVNKPLVVEQKKIQATDNIEEIKQKQTNLQNHAEEIKEQPVVKKGKGKKKIQATKINIEEFDNIQFDNGISKAQKDAMIKASDNVLNAAQNGTDISSSQQWSQPSVSGNISETIKVQAPKQMDVATAKQTLDKLKQQQQKQHKNIKALSSADFKDTTSTPSMQHNLQKLEGKQGFGSSQFYGQQPQTESTADKIKNVLSNYGQKLYDRWSKYIKK